MAIAQSDNGDRFEMVCDPIEATSLHRPDTSWRFTDAHGHLHQWCIDGQPATAYSPQSRYETPTLIWIKDGEEYWEDDDEPHDVGHLECRQCGEHIVPRYTADETRQFIPGLKSLYINGQSVSQEEFERRARAAGLLP